MNVRLKDIDFENDEINIFQQKTNSFKSIPLSKGLYRLILEIINGDSDSNILNLRDKESYLFFNKIRNIPTLKLRCDTVSKQFKKILRKLKLSNDFKFHSLRHSAITELIKKNVPLNVVKQIEGHANIQTTMIYSHVKRNDLREAMDKVNYA